MPFRTRRLTAWVAGAAALATLAIAFVDPLRFAYASADVHVAIATAVSLIGFLAAGLVHGRFRRSAQLQDLALTAALLLLSGTNLFFSVIPTMLGYVDSQFVAWAPLAGRVLGAIAFALSVAVPDRQVRDLRRASMAMVGSCVVLLGGLALLTAWLSPHWGDPLVDMLRPEDSVAPHLTKDVVLLVMEAVMFALYAIAAIGFVARAERTGDELFGWFALASPLAAIAHLNYLLFPSLYPGWVYTGDLFRLGFYLMLLAGAARQIAAWQRELAEAAAHGERRRIARDLHDGLAQELAFIVGQMRSLVEQSGAEGPFANVAAAAERALDESRTAITALSRDRDDPLDVALAQAAEDVAGRTGAHVRFDLAAGIRVEPELREDLARIVREAVSNAARHGDARTVTVALSNTDAIRLRITDDGRGFDPAAPRRRGFGLTSMRERAEGRGGSVEVRSQPGHGTEVEVIIPA
ncbi:MAG: sensor histidine kinase [Thermoleophilaceae bacterium]